MATRALLYRRPYEPSTLLVKHGSQIYSVRLRRHRRARRYTLRIHPSDREAILTMPPRGTIADAKDFALEVIVHAPLDMRRLARHAKDPLTAFARFRPHRAARAGAMHDPVRDAAQRQHGARKKWCRLWQTTETRGDPATVTLREILGVGDGAARRHGQDRFTVAWMNAQRVAARAPMPAQPHRVDLRAMFHQKARRFVRPPIKKGASGHVCDSGEEEFARILPYPPPVKSLGAKTNHLPNIQGLTG